MLDVMAQCIAPTPLFDLHGSGSADFRNDEKSIERPSTPAVSECAKREPSPTKAIRTRYRAHRGQVHKPPEVNVEDTPYPELLDAVSFRQPRKKAWLRRQPVLLVLGEPFRPERYGLVRAKSVEESAVRLGGSRPSRAYDDYAASVIRNPNHLGDHSRSTFRHDMLKGVDRDACGDAPVRQRDSGTVARQAANIPGPRLLSMALVWTWVHSQHSPWSPSGDAYRARAHLTYRATARQRIEHRTVAQLRVKVRHAPRRLSGVNRYAMSHTGTVANADRVAPRSRAR